MKREIHVRITSQDGRSHVGVRLEYRIQDKLVKHWNYAVKSTDGKQLDYIITDDIRIAVKAELVKWQAQEVIF